LLSNLDMKENIALIKEVHKNISRDLAEKEAIEMLTKINLEDIANKRQNQCKKIEIFYVMIIRALMCDSNTIFIKSPFLLIDTLTNFDDIAKNISILNKHKGIIILDTYSNQLHYRNIDAV